MMGTVDMVDKDLGLGRWHLDMGVDFALPWYQRRDVLYFAEGPQTQPFDRQRLENMYRYLNHHGRLYIVQCYRDGRWEAVGDVTLAKDMLPIVLGEERYRNQGLGFRTLSLLVRYAKNELRWPKLVAHKIFTYNIPSVRLFKKSGFMITNSWLDENGIGCLRMERILHP